MPLPQHFHVGGVVHVPFQLLNGLPYRHIEQDAVVVVWAKICSIALGVFQSPYEARTPVSQGIYFLETGDKAGHDRIFQCGFHPPDVHLSDMQDVHVPPSYWPPNVPAQSTAEAGEARCSESAGAQGSAARNRPLAQSAFRIPTFFQVDTILFKR